jgi:hypothetical protein
MKYLIKLFFIFPIVFFTACGGEEEIEEEKIDVEKNPIGALMKMGENMKEQAEKMEENMEKNKDVETLHYDELIKFLPTSINGYSSDEPNGGSIDMSGMSYSSAEVRFIDDEDNEINITLLDYNAALSMYSMTTAMWASGLKIDTKDEFAQSIKFDDNINGWETYQKKTGTASLILGIGNRFLLTIEGDKQKNCDNLKEIAKSMDLKELSSK